MECDYFCRSRGVVGNPVRGDLFIGSEPSRFDFVFQRRGSQRLNCTEAIRAAPLKNKMKSGRGYQRLLVTDRNNRTLNVS